jgi:hypothetical protein
MKNIMTCTDFTAIVALTSVVLSHAHIFFTPIVFVWALVGAFMIYSIPLIIVPVGVVIYVFCQLAYIIKIFQMNDALLADDMLSALFALASLAPMILKFAKIKKPSYMAYLIYTPLLIASIYMNRNIREAVTPMVISMVVYFIPIYTRMAFAIVCELTGLASLVQKVEEFNVAEGVTGTAFASLSVVSEIVCRFMYAYKIIASYIASLPSTPSFDIKDLNNIKECAEHLRKLREFSVDASRYVTQLKSFTDFMFAVITFVVIMMTKNNFFISCIIVIPLSYLTRKFSDIDLYEKKALVNIAKACTILSKILKPYDVVSHAFSAVKNGMRGNMAGAIDDACHAASSYSDSAGIFCTITALFSVTVYVGFQIVRDNRSRS